MSTEDGWTPLMRRALALARRGQGGTSPNPMVGALILRDGRVMAEGWHHRAGGPHAEIEALRALGDGNAKGTTMVVTLEPCCHTGRTGPCTKALIAAGVERVIVGALDANPVVAGRGVAELQAAGIEVISGVASDEARALNRVFEHWIVSRQPWLTLKLAVSLDGRIAARSGERTTVTGPASAQRVQALRAAADVVMIGAETALVDRPKLTLREPAAGGNAEAMPPWRLVVDSHLRVPADAAVYAPTPEGGPALVATTVAADDARVRSLRAHHVEVLSLPGPDGRVDLAALLAALGAGSDSRPPRTSVLCEGGGVLAAALLAAELVDELMLFVAPKVFGAHGAAAVGVLETALTNLQLAGHEQVGEDVLLTYRRRTS